MHRAAMAVDGLPPLVPSATSRSLRPIDPAELLGSATDRAVPQTRSSAAPSAGTTARSCERVAARCRPRRARSTPIGARACGWIASRCGGARRFRHGLAWSERFPAPDPSGTDSWQDAALRARRVRAGASDRAVGRVHSSVSGAAPVYWLGPRGRELLRVVDRRAGAWRGRAGSTSTGRRGRRCSRCASRSASGRRFARSVACGQSRAARTRRRARDGASARRRGRGRRSSRTTTSTRPPRQRSEPCTTADQRP